MAIIFYFTLIIAAAFMLIVTQLVWAWRRLKRHPHVEIVELAKPEISAELNTLVEVVANTAGVAPPQLYVRRASLPNAFMIAAIIRPELYLTDELLEHCDSRDDGLNHLTQTICHEIAHIKRGDAIRLGFLTWVMHTASSLSIHSVAKSVLLKIDSIEVAADNEASFLYARLNEKG
ncbi:M48 family metalloprotease [Mariprofundus sp. KV]|uniref:M48 family metalloprotease n=1 Tax=Mariprofundus sp. KV TaxID=2608715 RepID=UPI001F511FC8|nr:M48 family metalloprotease [Mariprofundus sp. KV]